MARIVFNPAGFRELLTSPEVTGMLKEHADSLAERANAVPSTTSPAANEPYYHVYEASDEQRARFRVASRGLRAARHEAKTQALQKGLSSG
ncbi:MAG: hypothetical protein KDB47_06935 [Mycobacterium sp.]|nr:hypothetical protein [Mycobacterium sp.]